GLRTAREIVEASVREGVGTLTLYAFSSDNWKRPTPEVTALMRLFRRALLGEAKRCLENGVRLTILGRRDRLPSSLRHTIEQVEARSCPRHMRDYILSGLGCLTLVLRESSLSAPSPVARALAYHLLDLSPPLLKSAGGAR